MIRNAVRRGGLAALLAGLALFPAPLRAEETTPLALGREVIFLRPLLTIESLSNFSVAFDLVGRDESTDVTRPIRRHAAFARAVREYREHVAGLEGRAGPLFIALGDQLSGTAFCATQPAAIRVTEKDGTQRLRVIVEPIITLARLNLDDVRKDPTHGPEVLCHEIGHAFMAKAYGMLSFPSESPEQLVQLVTREGHWYQKETDPVFAYTEGWAEYSLSHFTDANISAHLLQTPVEAAAGKSPAERPLTAAEIRRHEGAQAYLLFHLERRLQRPGIFREFLDVMHAEHPRTTNGLLRAYVAHHPELRDAVDGALREISHGAFAVDYSYTAGNLQAETRPSWKRLGDALRKAIFGTRGDEKRR